MDDRPNILLIITDQQNYRMLGCAGNRYVSTPAMDSIADGGVRFDRAYSANPVCIASRFSLMTGLLPSAIGMISNSTARVQEVPEAIKANGLGHLIRGAGYEAVYAGKVHLPKMTAQEIGFEYICTDERDDLASVCADYLEKPKERPFFLVASFINPHDICYMALRDFAEDKGEKGIVAGGVIECATLDRALARPAVVDEAAFFEKYCPPLPPNFEPQQEEPEAIQIMLEARPFRAKARRLWSERRWREHRWVYARLTEFVDAQIGKVLGALRESGEWDRTLIVFTSDHGDMDSAHRMEHKSAVYDESCRIPLIVRPPGGIAGGRVDREHVISNGLDLVPTLCDCAGATTPAGRLGRSLRPLVGGAASVPWRDHLPIECAIGRAIFTQGYKYARYDIGERSEQLIDLGADPNEMRNAANDPGQRDTLGELRSAFENVFGKGPRDPKEVADALAES